MLCLLSELVLHKHGVLTTNSQHLPFPAWLVDVSLLASGVAPVQAPTCAVPVRKTCNETKVETS